MTKYYLKNGVRVAYTAEEEAARDAEEAKVKADLAANKYKSDRQFDGAKIYPNLSEQFDKLFHDVASGKFGDTAKEGEWYISIKEVKESNPKPS